MGLSPSVPLADIPETAPGRLMNYTSFCAFGPCSCLSVPDIACQYRSLPLYYKQARFLL